MKNNIYVMIAKIAAVVLMVAAIVVMAVCLKRQGDEKRRLKENYYSELSKDKAKQQTIDIGELKEYFHKEVETLKEFGIKPRDVEHIVEVTYYYHDTTVVRDTLLYIYDTVKNAREAGFCVQSDCYNIEGRLIEDTLEISGVTAYDELLISLYKEKRKCLFGKRKIRAIAVSGCSGDTLAVVRNLKVER